MLMQVISARLLLRWEFARFTGKSLGFCLFATQVTEGALSTVKKYGEKLVFIHEYICT